MTSLFPWAAPGILKVVVRESEMGLLFDEYKILQDKIDKIGGFRVTIKSWAVTVTAGVVVAIAGGKLAPLKVGALAIDLLVLFFFIFERRQTKLNWAFNSRARLIEVRFDKIRRKPGKPVLFSTPNIARSLFGSKRRRHNFIPFSFPGRKLETLRHRVNDEVRLWMNADVVFYLVLGLAAWAPKWLGPKPESSTPPITVNSVIQLPAVTCSGTTACTLGPQAPVPTNIPGKPHPGTEGK